MIEVMIVAFEKPESTDILQHRFLIQLTFICRLITYRSAIWCNPFASKLPADIRLSVASFPEYMLQLGDVTSVPHRQTDNNNKNVFLLCLNAHGH